MMGKNEKQILSESDLNAAFIRNEIEGRGACVPEICLYYETDSTNREARAYHNANGKKEAVFIADGQTAGRGRRGRSFSSLHGAGIYMSLLLYPEGELCDLTVITAYTAVAVCRAIESVCGVHADIKWVNDIYYKGKKLGGILTEGALSGDMKTAEYVVVGIGLNLLKQDFPSEISDIALSLEDITGKKISRNLLIAAIISEFLLGRENFRSSDVLEEYRRRSFLVGREITVHKLSGSYNARVVSIGDDMSLRIILTDGIEEILVTGEVSVREK